MDNGRNNIIFASYMIVLIAMIGSLMMFITARDTELFGTVYGVVKFLIQLIVLYIAITWLSSKPFFQNTIGLMFKYYANKVKGLLK